GAQVVVGVNKYRVDHERPFEVLSVDNQAVRAAQIAKLEKLRAERDPQATARALDALTSAAARATGSMDDNLLALAVDAARAKATVGEISDALEKVFGRHTAVIRTISGVYRSESTGSDSVERVLEATAQFEREHGRRPRRRVALRGQ